MAGPITRLVQMRDFTGGLNERADQFTLAPNESPEILNMDIDPRGGFRTRRGIKPITTTALGATPLLVGTFANDAGTQQILAQSANTLYYSTGANFVTTAMSITAASRAHMVTFSNYAYIQDGTALAKQWNGTAGISLGEAWSPDIAAPTSGNMPRSRYAAVFHNRVWLAGVTEAGVLKPNRIRFSHLGKAEAWRQNDFIDIDIGADGDEITALLPFKDELLVFKRRSVHAVFGFDEFDFRTLPTTQAAGAPSQEAVCASPVRAYWFTWPDGVYAHDGSKTYSIFEKIRPAINNHTINPASGGPVMVWAENRLFVGVPWDVPSDPTDGRHTLVFDPTLPEGSWTRYDLSTTSGLFWRRNDGTAQYLFTVNGTNHVYTMADEVAQQGDNYGVGGLTLLTDDGLVMFTDDFLPITLGTGNGDALTPIVSRYTTRWEDAGLAQAKKQFRRPRIVAYAEADATVRVKVYRDFDNRKPSKTMDLNLVVTGVGSNWDSVDDGWDTAEWAADTEVNVSFDRLSSLGLCNAVQLVFETDTAVARWGIDAIAIPTVIKKVR